MGNGALPAGEFSSWLRDTRAALGAGGVASVPCQGCTACCTSSQFVHVGPDERDTLARIPEELLVPAPGMPAGHVVLGYDERGHCPMLVDGWCSIYEHRPRTCRTYDCRALAAARFEADDDVPVEIAERATRWRFRYASEAAELEHAAVRAAATFLAEHPEVLAPERGRPSLNRLAALAVQISNAFVEVDAASGDRRVVAPSTEVVRAAVARAA